MLQTGIVREVNVRMPKDGAKRFGAETFYEKNNGTSLTADVEIKRSSACGESCASCGLCPGQTARVFAVNDLGAKTGDTVIIDMADKKVLGAAFLVYIMPIIMLIAGYFISYAMFNSERLAVLTGFIFLAVTFISLMRLDKRLKSKYTPRIVQIITESGDAA